MLYQGLFAVGKENSFYPKRSWATLDLHTFCSPAEPPAEPPALQTVSSNKFTSTSHLFDSHSLISDAALQLQSCLLCSWEPPPPPPVPFPPCPPPPLLHHVPLHLHLHHLLFLLHLDLLFLLLHLHHFSLLLLRSSFPSSSSNQLMDLIACVSVCWHLRRFFALSC